MERAAIGCHLRGNGQSVHREGEQEEQLDADLCASREYYQFTA
jgi:hypothetical protein